MSTKYILEYKYDDDMEWQDEAEYDLVSDAQFALIKHANTYNFIHVRVRQVKYIIEESIVGEYKPVTVTEDL